MTEIIKPGTFRSINSAYGNHLEQIKGQFLSCGWAIHKIDNQDLKHGNTVFVTFVSGEGATMPNIDYPNAHLI